MPLSLRSATRDDAALLLTWRNDPTTRAMSANTALVSEEEHMRWLTTKLDPLRAQADRTGVFILELSRASGPQRIGMGRIEHESAVLASLSYSIDAKYRGKGYGKELVRRLVQKARLWNYHSVKARVRRDNGASVMCAILAGVNCIEVFG